MKNIIDNLQLEYLNSLRAEENPLILEMEAYAKEHKVPILDRRSEEFLELMILGQKPERVLEIGTAIAYSAIHIARNLPQHGTLDTIELSDDNYNVASQYIAKCENKEKINLIKGDALKIMRECEQRYDFIFLDADKEDYKELFELSIPLLKIGSTIFIDNLLWHGYAASEEIPDSYKTSAAHIKEFNKYFIEYPSLKSTILTIGDGIGLAVKTD